MTEQISFIWYGHAAVQVFCSGHSVLIDPFLSGNPSCTVAPDAIPDPDAVLVTHDHGDHTGDAVSICNRTGAACCCIVGTAEKLIKEGLHQACVPAGIGFNIGGSVEINGIRITMTQAFHSTDSGSCTGFVVTMPGGFTFYHAGDTGIFGDMALIGELYRPDFVMLPCGGHFTMDGFQAAQAARLLRAPRLLPIHWGTFPILEQDLTSLRDNLRIAAPHCQIIAAVPGRRTALI
ncbi:MAG: metal-dependent hydrolase [Desulfovibrionaceae bacterium]|nr:metal-dependent hydrolase [Desulfovibrionaceae bacterium]